MLKKFLLFLSVSAFCFNATGQELHFKSLTVNEGLSQHDVSCILQDSNGFIWIGTYDGLNKYDGFRVQNFFHQTDDVESLSSNRITCLFEDSQKRIWIGTDGGGLNYYSLVSEKFIRVRTPSGFDLIKGIAENKNGEIYLATSKGVLKIVENKKIYADLVQLPLTGLDVTSIALGRDDKVYFSTNNGVWSLKK